MVNRYLTKTSAISKMRSQIEALEKDVSLLEEKNFCKRTEAIDFIEFQIISQIEILLQKANKADELISLKHWAEKIKSGLAEIDDRLFQRLRAGIRAGKYRGQNFKALVHKYAGFNFDDEQQREPGYDNLDIFINGLFPSQTMPEQKIDLEPGMVFYQKTPARIIFELVEKVHFTKDDVFFDLGSGLGQSVILVNLLTGITVKGVELEPAFCDYARACADDLNLLDVAFINTDARKADYSGGTIFFMYTPFTGEMMQQVLAALKKESLKRKIKIITYGPCTEQVALENWLHPSDNQTDNIYKLSVFTSL